MLPRIEVLASAPGPATTVRVEQPFKALQTEGVELRVHHHPFELAACVRPHSLVIWQRPLPVNWAHWSAIVSWLRSQGCLLLVEWDDHPELFSQPQQQRMEECNHAHLRLCHGVQTSNMLLAETLRRWQPHVFCLENGVSPVPALCLQKHQNPAPLRVFLGNFNREAEHQLLLPQLRTWLEQQAEVQLVTAGPSGIENRLPSHSVEHHSVLPYRRYRELLASCHVALLPLARGLPQACKTAIKWQEAGAESVAVVAGPELYGPWLAGHRYGLMASSLNAVVPLAQKLGRDRSLRCHLVEQTHREVQRHCLQQQLPWRLELYRHVWRLRSHLDHSLLQRWPHLRP